MKIRKKKPTEEQKAAERMRKERALRDGLQKIVADQIPITIHIPKNTL
jgi:hypothetical protein